MFVRMKNGRTIFIRMIFGRTMFDKMTFGRMTFVNILLLRTFSIWQNEY